MPEAGLTLAGCVAVASLVVLLAYRRIWLSRPMLKPTPTGFGVLLPFILLAAALATRMADRLIIAFAILSLASALYWIDDLRGLGARVRVAISFTTGAALCAVLLSDGPVPLPWLVAFSAIAGILNVALTNLVNFYDGADLNLATFIALVAAALLLTQPTQGYLTTIAIACLAFLVPFAIFNSWPRTIYLGDAGSFAFAGLLTLLIVQYLKNRDFAPEVAIPLALPALDTFFVLCIRITEKHDLLTRHTLHLYQRLNEHYRGFGYLIPQFVNAALVVLCVLMLRDSLQDRLAAVLVASVVVTVPFYFFCWRLLLPPRNGSTS
jgi:UDP-N-acetylmuramyl pentapeptide phosphotransferase/UDP-N-acetylglucosamine-1-phosphate transferase